MSPLKVEVRVQSNDFDIEMEIENLRHDLANIGAIVTFCGLVREFESNEAGRNLDVLSKLILEHYPGMTEKCIEDIVKEAANKWNIEGVIVIHRVGTLNPNEKIVFVGVASSHRLEAFRAAEFIMDYLKVHATLWKKIVINGEQKWIEPKSSDHTKFQSWSD